MSRIIGVALFLCLGIAMPEQEQQESPKVVKINDSISMAPLGANVYLVKTPAGNVIIDTGTTAEALDARKLLGAESHAPTKFIILTHGHADHIGGLPFVKEPREPMQPQIKQVEMDEYVARLGSIFVPGNKAELHGPTGSLRP